MVQPMATNLRQRAIGGNSSLLADSDATRLGRARQSRSHGRRTGSIAPILHAWHAFWLRAVATANRPAIGIGSHPTFPGPATQGEICGIGSRPLIISFGKHTKRQTWQPNPHIFLRLSWNYYHLDFRWRCVWWIGRFIFRRSIIFNKFEHQRINERAG